MSRPSSRTDSYSSTSYRDPFWDRPSTLFKQKFGDILSEDLVKKASFSSSTSSSSYFDIPFKTEFLSKSSPFNRNLDATGTSKIINDPKNFQIFLDVSQFKLEEVDVKTVGNEVVIHCKHGEREDDHGFVSREFTRRYPLPLGMDPERIECFFDTKGILAVKSKKVEAFGGKETIIRVEEHAETSSAGRNFTKVNETRTSSSSNSTTTKKTPQRVNFAPKPTLMTDV